MGKRRALDNLIREVGAGELRLRTKLDERTIRWIRRGERIPREETAKRIAAGLGVGVDEIIWPRGYHVLVGTQDEL